MDPFNLLWLIPVLPLVGAAVNGDTVYVAVLFSTDLGLKRLDNKAGTKDGTTVTSLENPAAARMPEAPPNSAPSAPQLRGGQGLH